MPKTSAKTKTAAKSAAPAKITAKSKSKSAKKRASTSWTKPAITLQVTDNQPFFEFRVTQQTLYWAILGAISIAFAMWVYSLDARIQKLYDEIDSSTYSTEYDMPTKSNEQKNPTEITEQQQ